MDQRLQGQTAWISGAASGIGAATARLFAEEGANVAAGRHPCRSGTARRQCDTLFLQADVAERGPGPRLAGADRRAIWRPAHHRQLRGPGPRQAVARVRRGRLGPADGRQPQEHLLLGQAWPANTCERQSPSYVVNVGSISSFVGQAATPAYTASKSAVLGLTRVRSRSTTPRSGCAATASVRGSPTRRCCASIWTRPRTPRRPWPSGCAAFRCGLPLTPDDIARAILYLSCEDSAGVTGTSLVVDGGYLAAAEWDAG